MTTYDCTLDVTADDSRVEEWNSSLTISSTINRNYYGDAHISIIQAVTSVLKQP